MFIASKKPKNKGLFLKTLIATKSRLSFCLLFLLEKRKSKPVIGIEPTTYGLQNRCSTVELHRQVVKIIIFIKDAMSSILVKSE